MSLRSLFRAVALGLIPLIPGCAPVDLLNATIPTGGITVTRDIAYGPGPRQMLDIYRPDAPGPLPVVVFIYGGSWRDGEKGNYKFVAAALARHGVVTVVPDYRLYPQVKYPGFVQDGAAAVAWTFGHVAAYGGDTNRLFVMGHSAGAYIAAMLALDPDWLAADGIDRDRLAGMIGLAGPYDFLPIEDPDIIPIFAVPDQQATQPIAHVDGRNPPMFLAAGSDDTTVLPRNTTRLAAKIRAAGGPVTDKIYPGIGHVGIVIAMAPLFRGKAPVLDDVLAFIRQPRDAPPPPAAPAR
jgi:acetyl esterase/lipase